MTKYFELRRELNARLRAGVKKNVSDEKLEEVICTLVAIGDEVNYGMLQTVGDVLFDDPKTLSCLEPDVLNPIIRAMALARAKSRAMAFLVTFSPAPGHGCNYRLR